MSLQMPNSRYVFLYLKYGQMKKKKKYNNINN